MNNIKYKDLKEIKTLENQVKKIGRVILSMPQFALSKIRENYKKEKDIIASKSPELSLRERLQVTTPVVTKKGIGVFKLSSKLLHKFNSSVRLEEVTYSLNEELPKKPMRVVSKKPSIDKEKLTRAIATIGMLAIVSNAVMGCSSDITRNNKEKGFNFPVIEEYQDVDIPEVRIEDYSNIKLGSSVLVDTNTPIYKNSMDSIHGVNPVDHYFEDNDDRIIEAITYRYLEGKTPKYVTIYATDEIASEKVALLEEKGATPVSVLISKASLTSGEYGHEGFKNIKDIRVNTLGKANIR